MVKLTTAEKNVVELLRVIRSRFSDEHVQVVLSLLPMAPHAGEHTKRLPASAYRKGLLAGLSYDSADASYPDCPYDRALPNFAKNANDPREAWRAGSRDALRIRDIVLWPETRTIFPALAWREYKVLTPEIQRAFDAREGRYSPSCSKEG